MTGDVIAGVFVGLSLCTLNAVAFGGRVMHFGEPIEDATTAARAANNDLTRNSS